MNRLLMAAVATSIISCGAKKEASEGIAPGPTDSAVVMSTRPASVYRTGTDHKDHVPVLLSEDRKSIISYPHPRDLRSGSGYALPTPLGQGYLLDNRGIGLNVAFLSMTYEQYAALETPPSLKELDSLVIDRDPLIELCDCGPRSGFQDLVPELTSLVRSGTLETRCKRLK